MASSWARQKAWDLLLAVDGCRECGGTGNRRESQCCVLKVAAALDVARDEVLDQLAIVNRQHDETRGYRQLAEQDRDRFKAERDELRERHSQLVDAAQVDGVEKERLEDELERMRIARAGPIPPDDGAPQGARQLLRVRMRDVSKDRYYAGWEIYLEYRLWNMVQGGPRHWGLVELSIEQVAELRGLAERAGGWWHWDKAQGAERFVEMAEWERLYAEHGQESGA